ncbi:MAG: response regulator transcription factor [Ignavibacteria bacterium]|jgi:DNA-binding NarL/FixJ family response regulator
MIKVLIADENEMILKGLKEILLEDRDIELVGESSSIQDLVSQINMHNFDIVILGISISGKSDIDNISDIKKLKSDVKIILLTINPQDEIAKRVIKAGAAGYLKKDSIPGELISAVREVYNGRVYMNHVNAELNFN